MIYLYVRQIFEGYFESEWPALVARLQGLTPDRLSVLVRPDSIIVTETENAEQWRNRRDVRGLLHKGL